MTADVTVRQLQAQKTQTSYTMMNLTLRKGRVTSAVKDQFIRDPSLGNH